MKKSPEKPAMAEFKEELDAEVSELKSQIYYPQMERDALRKQYRLKDLLEMFQISKSSYCYQEKSSAQPDKHQNLRVQIQEIFEPAYHGCGYRRIYAALKKTGTLVSGKAIRRIMKVDKYLKIELSYP